MKQLKEAINRIAQTREEMIRWIFEDYKYDEKHPRGYSRETFEGLSDEELKEDYNWYKSLKEKEEKEELPETRRSPGTWETEDPEYFDGKEQITEDDLEGMGFEPTGKLYGLVEDKDILVILTDDGRALPLRID